MALVNYWVIGTHRETLVVSYERRFVKLADAQAHRNDMAERFPADVYHVQQETQLFSQEGTDMAATTKKEDPYKAASAFGLEQGKLDVEFTGSLSAEQEQLLDKVAYWSAWRGARNAASALLNKAADLNLTPEQFHALTEVAEEWAYD